MNKVCTDIDLDSIFTEEWYQNITSAAVYALTHLNTIDEKAKDRIALQIVDYNIEKAIKNALLSGLMDTLPKTLNWKNKQVTTAFTEFKDIIDTCCICPAFKEYKVKILFKKTSILLAEFLNWNKLVEKHYPNIGLSIIPTRDPYAFYLKLEKN